MKIRERLTLQFVILATGLLMVSSLFLYLFVQGISESQFENRVLGRLKTVSAQWTIVFPRDSLRLAQIEDSRKYLLPDEQTAIFDLDGRLLFATADFSGFEATGEILALLDREKKWSGWQGNYFIAGVSASTSDKNYYIVSGARNTEGENNLGQLRLIMVGLFVLMLAMVALTGWIFSGRALRPIHKVIANINS
ncbi:MAG: hypothetical protein ACKO3B_15030, partial [Bacteroidota bacterium]